MTKTSDVISGKPWIINPDKPCYGLSSTEGYGLCSTGKIKYFSDLNSACNFASNLYARQNGLPDGKYHLQWDIALKDENYTRIYESKFGKFRIVAYVI